MLLAVRGARYGRRERIGCVQPLPFLSLSRVLCGSCSSSAARRGSTPGVVDIVSFLPFPQTLLGTFLTESQQPLLVRRVATLNPSTRTHPGHAKHLLRGGDFVRRPERPGLFSHVPAVFRAAVPPPLPAAAAAASSGCMPLQKDQACGLSSFSSSHAGPPCRR